MTTRLDGVALGAHGQSGASFVLESPARTSAEEIALDGAAIQVSQGSR